MSPRRSFSDSVFTCQACADKIKRDWGGAISIGIMHSNPETAPVYVLREGEDVYDIVRTGKFTEFPEDIEMEAERGGRMWRRVVTTMPVIGVEYEDDDNAMVEGG